MELKSPYTQIPIMPTLKVGRVACVKLLNKLYKQIPSLKYQLRFSNIESWRGVFHTRRWMSFQKTRWSNPCAL